MTPKGAARHPLDVTKIAFKCGVFVAWRTLKQPIFLLALGAVLVATSSLRAQARQGLFLVLDPPRPSAADGRVHRLLARREPAATLLTEDQWHEDQRGFVPPRALARLREADVLMTEAKHCLADLDEPTALRRLSRAEQLLAAAMAAPGAASFYAEAELQLGITAAQLGLWTLTEAAFGRAARLAPGRRLLAGEAPPDVIRWGNRVFDAAASAPDGEVRVEVDAPAAHVFIDDVERGVAPLLVRAHSGTHALRIEAYGREPYATLFEVVEGRRPEQQVSLSIDERSRAAGQLRAEVEAADASQLQAAAQTLLNAAPELSAVAFRQSARRPARELLFVCDRSGCRNPLRLGADERSDEPISALSSVRLAAARQWLSAPDPLPEPTAAEPSLWRRWYFWSALTAALVGSGVLIALAAQPEPTHTLRVTVDPGALR
jgi:hypothetical protein